MRRDAAGDENAALGIEAECKVAGKFAEERAKSIECGAAHRAAAGDARPGDRRSATFRNGPRFEQSNRLIEIFQAVAGECAFGRDVAEFVPQLLDNRVLE